MKTLTPIVAILEVRSGANISDCHLEAIQYSINNMINVEYVHNGQKYLIIFNDLFGVPIKSETNIN